MPQQEAQCVVDGLVVNQVVVVQHQIQRIPVLPFQGKLGQKVGEKALQIVVPLLLQPPQRGLAACGCSNFNRLGQVARKPGRVVVAHFQAIPGTGGLQCPKTVRHGGGFAIARGRVHQQQAYRFQAVEKVVEFFPM